MLAALHLKPEEIDTAETRGKYTISVIGCGHESILCAVAFAEAGFKVICTDANQSLIKRLEKGKAPFVEREVESKLKRFVRTGQLSATSEIGSATAQSDIIVIMVTAKIDAKKNPDYSEIESISKQVGTSLRRGSLVIYGGIAGFGFIEGVLKETLENTSGLKVGEDFGLAYSPIQLPDEQTDKLFSNQELKVAAIEKTSLNSASAVLGAITKKNIKKTLNVKTAELAALFAAVKRDVSAALSNELAVFCENAGQDYFETCEFSDMDMVNSSFPTISEENNRSEAYLLLENAENINTKLRILALARQTNEKLLRHAVNLTKDALRSCGKTLRRTKIALLGAVNKPNTRTGPKTTTYKFAEMLEAKGVKVSLYDPYLSNELTEVKHLNKRNLNEALEDADCVIILVEHDQFKRLNLKKLRAIMRMPAAIVDLTGIIEPHKVEKEGFIYRGLGRGVWKK